MSIIDKQINKKVEEITLESLRKGKVPAARDIAIGLKPFMQKVASGPSFSPRFQPWRRTWDYVATNKSLKDIKFDLDIAVEEVVDQLSKMIRRNAFVELAYSSQKMQIETLIGTLTNLLFVSKNTDDSFAGVFDTFTDLSKVDVRETTQDAVDLSEGCVLLPANDIRADRVNMSHLYGKTSWPVTASEVTPGVTGSLVQNEVVPQSAFGNAFSDMVSSWRQVVTIGNNGGARIEFTIPLSGTMAEGVTISRIGITSSAADVMYVSVLGSLDNVNYTKFAGLPEEISVASGSTTNIDFESARVQFVRFSCRLNNPTVVDGGSFGYVFGFKNISFYKLGRVIESQFVSLPLAPTGLDGGIDKVAMNVVEDIPRGCSIDYFIAPYSATAAPTADQWRPITPLNRQAVDGISKVVRFGQSTDKSVSLPPLDPAVIYDTVRGIDLYQLNEDPLEFEPTFHTAFLRRGDNSWFRNTQRNAVIREARDAFIDFTSGDVQNMYAVATQQPDVTQEPKTNGGANLTALTVDRAIDYNVSTMLLIPGKNTNPETDQRPRYAIYKVQRLRDNMTVTNESVVAPSDFSWKQLANYGIKATGTGRPVIKNASGSVTYTEGKDYELELESTVDPNAPNVLSGRFRRLSTGSIQAGATIKVSYILESDITYMVDSIRTDKIFLKKDLGNVPDQYFLVTFRFIPRTPNKIRKSTLNVTSSYGSTSGTSYSEGPDFIVDTSQGTITRVPTGRIQGTLQVYVDFQYEEQPPDLDTFTTWVRVDSRDPLEISFSPPGLDIDAGERFAVDSIDISGQTTLPSLGFGWHQITVRSRRPEAVGTAAINLIAKLTDRNGTPIFVSGGKYFAQMIASREPLFQRTYIQLAKNTPKGDHGYFAITSEGYVVVNFEPGSTEEIYTYGYRLNESNTYELDSWPEYWTLDYSYKTEEATPVEKILVKAILRRGTGTDGGVTPKVHEYHIRLA